MHMSMHRIQSFHQFIRHHANSEVEIPHVGIGKYCLGNIANMEQTPLEFEFLTGGTYETTGASTVQVPSQASGLEKRQAATIFGDGVSRVKPLIVLRGKGTKLLKTEKSLWDKRVVVGFQDNACHDELTPMLDQPIESSQPSALMHCIFVQTTPKYGQYNVDLLMHGFDP